MKARELTADDLNAANRAWLTTQEAIEIGKQQRVYSWVAQHNIDLLLAFANGDISEDDLSNRALSCPKDETKQRVK